MHKPYILILSIIFFFIACRKDESAYIGDNNQQTCLIQETKDFSGNLISSQKYDEDFKVIEFISYYEGEIDGSQYLVKEKKGQYLFYQDGKEIENLVARIYFNEDGTLQKEVALIVENGNFEEDLTSVDHYIYNSKKQLIRIDSENSQETAFLSFEYDEKDRVKYISVKNLNGEEVSYYDKFTYEDRAKTDNFVSFFFSESISRHFIPSVNNVYLKSYNLVAVKAGPNNGDVIVPFQFNYTFAANKLQHVITSGELFGIPFIIEENITLRCK